MTAHFSAAQLAVLHRAAFVSQRPWTRTEFENLLASKHCHALTEPNGFALIRVIADEAELLTLAVHPEHQNAGLGRSLLTRAMLTAHEYGAFEIFLEVAEDNARAVRLYLSSGFAQVATRANYYSRANSEPVDALLLSRSLP